MKISKRYALGLAILLEDLATMAETERICYDPKRKEKVRGMPKSGHLARSVMVEQNRAGAAVAKLLTYVYGKEPWPVDREKARSVKL